MIVDFRLEPVARRPDLLAEPVATALGELDLPGPVEVAEIDPELADTAAFSTSYGVPLEQSANCVVVAARHGSETRLAACVVLATTRADVNGTVRRRLGARKVSFAPRQDAVGATGMEFGGITPSVCQPNGRVSSTRRPSAPRASSSAAASADPNCPYPVGH